MNHFIITILAVFVVADQVPTLIRNQEVQNQTIPSCWKLAYGRGAGTPLTSCDGYYPDN